MKRKILVLVLLCLSFMSYGQIKFNGDFETGYEDRSMIFYDSVYNKVEHYSIAKFKDNMYGMLKFNSEFKGFSIYTSNKTYFVPLTLISYNPLLTEYRIGAKYKYKRFIVGYEHMCSHSIDRKYFREAHDRFFFHIKLF